MDKEKCVIALNKIRSNYQCTKPLVWDDQLADLARRKAKEYTTYDCTKIACSVCENYGSWGRGCEYTIKHWYRMYIGKWDQQTCKYSGATKATYMVWKHATKFGFGHYFKTNGNERVVACYDHPGCYHGGRKVKTEEHCRNVMPFNQAWIDKQCTKNIKPDDFCKKKIKADPSYCKKWTKQYCCKSCGIPEKLKKENFEGRSKSVDGHWGSWRDAGHCNRLCGKDAKRRQTRPCEGVQACGKLCPGPGVRYVPCNQDIDCKAECVKTANMYRSYHIWTPPLTWDDELADKSQKWADIQMKKAKATKTWGMKNKHDYAGNKKDKTGENMARIVNDLKRLGTHEIDLLWACRYGNWLWYGTEIVNYNFMTGKRIWGREIGHFTQCVWRETKKFGLGFAVGKDKGLDNGLFFAIVVAKYFPAGNLMGNDGQHYRDNVGFLREENRKMSLKNFLAPIKKRELTPPK